MIKKSLRLMLLGAFALMSSVFVACDKYDDDIQGLQQQIDAMGSQFESLKAQVAGLQGEIDGGAVITDVKATAEGIVVTLSNGKSYTVKNGEKGEKGDKGDQGIQGEKGDKGDQGEKGDKGDQGEQGIQGEKGDKGDKGDQGEAGKDGQDGKDGVDGKDGKDGVDGKDGKDGENGKDGKDGENGKDGVDGKDGKDGSVVTIGANGNWFIDGVDTGKPSQGAAGKDGKDGVDGKDGKDGVDGKDGKDGENGKDGINGTNGKDGVDGKDGKDADVIYFEPCTDKDNTNYGKWVKYVNGEIAEVGESWLHDGVLTAVYDPFTGELTFHGVEGQGDEKLVVKTGAQLASLAIVSDDLSANTYMPIVSNYTIYTKQNAVFVTSPIEMLYRVNPTNAVLKNVNFSFIDRVVNVKAAGDQAKLLAIPANGVTVNTDGTLNVKADFVMSAKEFAKPGHNVFALKATLADGAEVVSDFAEFRTVKLSEFKIADVYDLEDDEVYNHFCPTTKPAVDAAACASFVYTGSIDLDDIVALMAKDGADFDFVTDLGFDVTYKFEKVKNYFGTDGVTDQGKFVTINENNEVSVDSEWLNKGTAAVGKTPVFTVKASVADSVLATAYIKLAIVEKEIDPIQFETIEVKKAIEYMNIKASVDAMTYSWSDFTANVYDELGLTHTTFQAYYDDAQYYSRYDGLGKATNDPNFPAGVSRGTAQAEPTGDVNSNVAAIKFDPNAIQLGKDTVVLIYEPIEAYRAIYPTVRIEFQYEISHTKAFPAVNADYQVANTTFALPVAPVAPATKVTYKSETIETLQTKGKVGQNGWELKNTIREFITNYALDANGNDITVKNHGAFKFNLLGVVINDTLRNIDLNPVFWAGKDGKTKVDLTTEPKVYGADLATNATLDDEIALSQVLKASEPSRVYVIEMTIPMNNGGECTKMFAVKFVRPFVVTMGNVTLRTLPVPDYANLDTLVVIEDFAGNLLYSKNRKRNESYNPNGATGNTGAVTAYAQRVYGLQEDQVTVDSWNVDQTGFGPQTLQFDQTNPGVLVWNNMGGDLQNDKTTTAKVILTVGNIAEASATSTVKVLSTANSR